MSHKLVRIFVNFYRVTSTFYSVSNISIDYSTIRFSNMPTFNVITNLPKHKVPSTFLSDASKVVSKLLSVPELHTAISIKAGQQMFWHDNDSLCGLGSLAGTGIYGTEANKHYTSVLYDFIEKELGIPQDRLYVSIVEQNPSNVGIRGTTLQDLIQ